MVDFVGILKKTIDAQNNITLQVRKQVYERAIETLEHKLAEANMPETMIDAQRQALQSAISVVEEEYLAVEKELLSSVIGWKFTNEFDDKKGTPSTAFLKSKMMSVFVTKQQHSFVTGSIRNEILNKSSKVLGIPDAELVNMDSFFASEHKMNQNIEKKTSKNDAISSGQVDNFHIISHIFAQALQRANRASVRKRIVIGVCIFVSFCFVFISAFFVGKRVFVSSDHQLQEDDTYVSNLSSTVVQANSKLTQRLLEDGSEIDVGPVEEKEAQGEKGISPVVANDTNSMKHAGEVVFYQSRTDYDAEKVATGSALWSLVKETSINGQPEELAIRGDIKIPDEGLSLRLTLRRNTDLSLPAAYIMDLIFITSDKFSGQAISDIKTLTFKASEQSVGQVLTRTVVAKIDDDFFLVALSGHYPFLNRNLQLIRELDWIRLVMNDKNGRVNELTFAKGETGEAIFNQVIGQWLAQTNKSTDPESIKQNADINGMKSIKFTDTEPL
ncbi:hypothetical protein [Bartonella bacilliformis]|uniref:Transmembrane protein n=1 Tax=Bartonella bacilliformis Ver097 TaxID=1293911 RepID=A0A072RHW5_BARBA|nr:hypothetical protein [Bartonella bacilliformis]KEG21084.1 hypothetical protein H710_00029 [Bartonella bacilliformis Ver097]